jgi:2-amino-4-hydroxy-6-hydroxymethyldihydropteridine diphosphokinase
MTFYVIAVGSNIEPEKYINQAFILLKALDKNVSIASLLRTKSVGFLAQADFVNTAFSLTTALDQNELSQYLKNIELQLGRVRTNNKNGPRTIDLDIVQVNQNIVDDDYHRYDFVKQSVDELTVNTRHAL